MIVLVVGWILPLALLMDAVAPAVGQIHKDHWGCNFEERRRDPPPHIWDSLGEVVGESPLLKGGQTVCDYMPDLGQVSKVAPHVYWRAGLKRQQDAYKHSHQCLSVSVSWI